MKPEFSPVSSSNIARLAHQDGHLWVEFRSGQVWKYAGVDKAKYDQMLVAPSIGKFFNAHIRPHHAGEKVDSAA